MYAARASSAPRRGPGRSQRIGVAARRSVVRTCSAWCRSCSCCRPAGGAPPYASCASLRSLRVLHGAPIVSYEAASRRVGRVRPSFYAPEKLSSAPEISIGLARGPGPLFGRLLCLVLLLGGWMRRLRWLCAHSGRRRGAHKPDAITILAMLRPISYALTTTSDIVRLVLLEEVLERRLVVGLLLGRRLRGRRGLRRARVGHHAGDGHDHT